MTDKEEYSTTKAWEGAENPETKYWRNMAEHFRKENKELKKEVAELKDPKKKDSYIETILKVFEK